MDCIFKKKTGLNEPKSQFKDDSCCFESHFSVQMLLNPVFLPDMYTRCTYTGKTRSSTGKH